MSENTTADKNPAPTDLPAPNGHTSNGVTAHESGGAAPSATPSVKKRKKKKPATKAGATPAPSVSAERAEAEQHTAPADLPQQENPPAEAMPAAASAPVGSELPAAEAVAEPPAPAVDPVAPPTDPDPAAAAEAPALDAAPETTAPPIDLLRLRMKVWTDPSTGKRFLMPSAFMRDVVNGQPVSDVMYAYAMSDEETKLVLLRAHEWNTLPFYYFYEDGPAPRASSRPVDVIVSGGRTS